MFTRLNSLEIKKERSIFFVLACMIGFAKSFSVNKEEETIYDVYKDDKFDINWSFSYTIIKNLIICLKNLLENPDRLIDNYYYEKNYLSREARTLMQIRYGSYVNTGFESLLNIPIKIIKSVTKNIFKDISDDVEISLRSIKEKIIIDSIKILLLNKNLLKYYLEKGISYSKGYDSAGVQFDYNEELEKEIDVINLSEVNISNTSKGIILFELFNLANYNCNIDELELAALKTISKIFDIHREVFEKIKLISGSMCKQEDEMDFIINKFC
jgi:hypothetical protein